MDYDGLKRKRERKGRELEICVGLSVREVSLLQSKNTQLLLAPKKYKEFTGERRKATISWNFQPQQLAFYVWQLDIEKIFCLCNLKDPGQAFMNHM